ncbi:MAG: NADP-dependent oxidoreductase [Rhizobiaceae bacterium]|nr:MAG: NADP-dependent oxidoreductase [Rhizobiaceae bacterium]CAG1011770.1 NADPH-dependent curcumin reductase [Rhizobiaceae bacterium]
MTAATRRHATQIKLVARPQGHPKPGDFAIASAPIPVPGEGEILVETTYLSLDPALRPRMNEVSAYAGAIPLHSTIPSPALGVVLESRSPLHKPGDHVSGMFGWQSHATVQGSEARRIDPERAVLPRWLSLLGLSSFTAYVGLVELGRPKPGETVVVSAAAGATGAAVGQIAKILGARAVGIAGGVAKCRGVVDVYGFDACVDYKAADFLKQLDAACPDGIDVDFENVGGDILRAVYDRMNQDGRVIVCGLVSEYNIDGGFPPGPSLWPTVYKSLRIEGFRASRYFDRVPEFIDKALEWSQAGLFTHREHITEGIENAPQAFVDMLVGRHFGKAMVRI